MLNPIQQTSLAFEPARQQITPPVQVPPPTPPRQADLPIPAGQNSQENSGPQQDGGSRGGSQDNAFERQAQADTAEKLRSAYARLTQLKQQASQSLVSGNARGAKEAAAEAAQVASTIRDVTGSIPVSGLGAIQTSADQLTQSSASSDSSSSTSYFSSNTTSIFSNTDAGVVPLATTGTSSSTSTILDLARSGLGTAKEVVDTAAAVPQQPIEDRRTIDSYMRSVLDAMAGVEAMAASAVDQATTKSSASSANGHLDIKA